MKNKDRLNAAINYENDYILDYFGFKVIYNYYVINIILYNTHIMSFNNWIIFICFFQYLTEHFLVKSENRTIERPQHLFMKVAVSIHGDDIDSAIETYKMLSQKLCMFSPVVMQLQPAAKKLNTSVIR